MNRVPGPPLTLVVLISNQGSNLQAIIDAMANQEIHVKILAVVSNNPNAPGLQRAKNAGIPTVVTDRADFATRKDFDRRLLQVVRDYDPGLVVMAGFMRILDDEFVEHFEGRLLNIHPSLLPKYPGLNTYRRVLSAKDSVHGCSIHFVNSQLDGGPVVAQSEVPIRADDDEISLSARVQAMEHKLYPMVIGWFARGGLVCQHETIRLDGKLLGKPRKIAFTDLDETQELGKL
ncbi:MAG: phosphoribosylglycinamide formyltransferase [Gammaproteobacteria bacterium]|nr:phosphoribosylglycinamide formyltransferase [Gammaproteobacteria bacterium]